MGEYKIWFFEKKYGVNSSILKYDMSMNERFVDVIMGKIYQMIDTWRYWKTIKIRS